MNPGNALAKATALHHVIVTGLKDKKTELIPENKKHMKQLKEDKESDTNVSCC